jgi:hypothetical protein
MGRHSRNGNLSGKPAMGSSGSGRGGGPEAITAKHNLLTDSWTSDVEALEAAIGRFQADRPITNDCQVVFFEIVRDRHLHVNVTHRHQTIEVRGWAGPAKLPSGFVHNRMFGDTPPSQMIRHIRDMIFAERI